MKTKIKWLVLFWPLALLANEDPFVWSYQIDPPSVVSGGEARLGVMFQIPPGHYLYKEKTRLELTEGEGISLGELEYSPAIRKQAFPSRIHCSGGTSPTSCCQAWTPLRSCA